MRLRLFYGFLYDTDSVSTFMTLFQLVCSARLRCRSFADLGQHDHLQESKIDSGFL